MFLQEFSQIVILFLLYSFMGWIWESIYCSLRAGKFVYRGFLFGPYCPIYGFALLAVIHFIAPYQKEGFVALFFASMVITTALEYFTSWTLEKIFHIRWWDYSDERFNLNGRISLGATIFWGMCCTIIVRYVNPEFHKFTQILNENFPYLGLVIFTIMSLDFILTIFRYTSAKLKLKKV